MSVTNEMRFVHITIRIAQIKEEIIIRGKRGGNFISNHPNLKNIFLIKCVKKIENDINEIIWKKSVELTFFESST